LGILLPDLNISYHFYISFDPDLASCTVVVATVDSQSFDFYISFDPDLASCTVVVATADSQSFVRAATCCPLKFETRIWSSDVSSYQVSQVNIDFSPHHKKMVTHTTWTPVIIISWSLAWWPP
jgi:hypothetical protein